MAEALRSRRVLAVLGISFINIGVNMGAVMTFFPGYAHLRFGTPSSGLGMCYGLSALGMLAGSLFVARNRRFPPFTVIRAAALLSDMNTKLLTPQELAAYYTEEDTTEQGR